MDLDELYRMLRETHVQTQGIVNTIRDPLLVLDSDLVVITANPAFYKTFDTGRDETIGIPFYELGIGQWNIEELQLLLEKVIPKSASVFDYEVDEEFPDVGRRTVLLSAQRIVHPGNGRRLLLLSIVDATERRQREDDKDLLLGEAHHRTKNMLSVTQAMARQTSVKNRTAEEYRDAFLGRLEALGRSLEISMAHQSAELRDLAHAVLEPYSGAVKVADEPLVALMPNQAMSLGMILHELATNAVKHGALSVPDARVEVNWDVVTDELGSSHINLRWRESDGPEVSPPSHEGFGTRLIRSAAQCDLGGSVKQKYEANGLTVEISLPGE